LILGDAAAPILKKCAKKLKKLFAAERSVKNVPRHSSANGMSKAMLISQF